MREEEEGGLIKDRMEGGMEKRRDEKKDREGKGEVIREERKEEEREGK